MITEPLGFLAAGRDKSPSTQAAETVWTGLWGSADHNLIWKQAEFLNPDIQGRARQTYHLPSPYFH